MSAKLPEDIRSMYTDAYRLHETFCGMGNTAEEWAACARSTGETCSRHGNHPLMMDLLLAVYMHLERERKAAVADGS